MAFNIEKAVRKRIPGLFMFWGPSASGKTYSALRFARGLVGETGRICVIDTENRRALLYAETPTQPGVGGAWDYVDFQPDFTTQRYIEVIRQVEQAGYDCVVIDSFSHVWQGEGGVLDEADRNTSNGLAKWAKPKMALKRLVNVALRSKCHVVFCLRAKMGVKSTGRGKEMEILSTGLTPVMEKGLIYEMLISILFGHDHKPMFKALDDRAFIDPHIPAVKAPAGLIEFIRPGEFVTEATGDAVRQWLEGGHRDVIDEARRIASRGTIVFREHWKTWGQSDREAISPFIPELQQISARADEEIARESDPKTWEEQTTDESAPDSGSGSNEADNALSGGFDGIPAQGRLQESAIQPPAQSHAQLPAYQPLAQAPVYQPPAPAVAQSVQQPAPVTRPPAVSLPPRGAAAPQTAPSPAFVPSGTNPF
ncbi:MAG: AAA family ATPase [Magnetococcales bacterium]|nr:AAA family ATPase [Magnetococcales bacterium]